MNGSLKYKITEWLDAEIRAGSDMYFTERDDKLYAGSTINDGDSRYTVGEQKFYENNFSFLISGHKDHILVTGVVTSLSEVTLWNVNQQV